MPEPTFLKFRLDDPNRSYQKVNVAGSFNNWNSTINELKFDDNSKGWLVELAVELSQNEKVYYKYITDNVNWICDETKPRETDESGIENNVTYAILKKDLSTVKVTDVNNEEELFDHKSFHDGELFDSPNLANGDVGESAPTSGDNNNVGDDTLNSNEVTVASTKQLETNDIPTEVPTDGLRPNTLWESIKWFLKYYVFAWLFPTS